MPLGNPSQIASGPATSAASCVRTLVLWFAAVALVVSLAGRTFGNAGDQHKSVRAADGEAKRQHLDRDSAGWSVPQAVFVPQFWPEVSAHVPAASEPLVSLDPYSSLYNRPPPTC